MANQDLAGPILDRVQQLCAEGDELAGGDHTGAAVARYEEALALLPDPKTRWEAATWIYAAIADAYFFAGDFAAAELPLSEITHCPGATGNAFVHLRRGQVALELGHHVRAADELALAYEAAGPEIFEDEHPKYLAAAQGVATG